MIPAHEVLLNNPAVENTIRENKLNQLKSIMPSGIKDICQARNILNIFRFFERFSKK